MFEAFFDTFASKSTAVINIQDQVSIEICISLVVATTMLNQVIIFLLALIL